MHFPPNEREIASLYSYIIAKVNRFHVEGSPAGEGGQTDLAGKGVPTGWRGAATFTQSCIQEGNNKGSVTKIIGGE
jgi:hypothetical protein